MKNTIFLILLLVCSQAQEDSPGTSAPMGIEVQEQDYNDGPDEDYNNGLDENSGIFQIGEFKKGMGPLDQFFLKDLFETITAAFDDIADNPNDQTFLQENKQSIDEIDGGVLKFESPMLGLFNPLFSIFTTEGDSDFVEVETISINGQTQTKVTKTSTRNGITTTTTEITTETSLNELNQDQENKLSDDFQLFENPTINEVLSQTDQNINQTEIIDSDQSQQVVTQVNLDNLDSIQELHVIQDNYVKNDQQLNIAQQSNDNFTLGITIVCGLSLAAVIGFSIKKFAFKTG
ncbi:unnamed protein product [Paramecium sonneborni]|uniref:Uncharacterized protein n=1 Tax=Paramecium sonneborni TaxID=65129 RepID=A0A8S1L617_9CILI|nr:unnamed protein product [Paramecium sonneborni]